MALGGRVVGVPVVGVGARLGGVGLGGLLLRARRVPAGARRLGSEGLAPARVLPLLVVLLKDDTRAWSAGDPGDTTPRAPITFNV